MSTFDALLFFHIIGVVMIAGGAGVGIAAGVTMPRTSSVPVIGTLSGLAAHAEHFVTTPGAILTLVTGTWFILDDSGPAFQQFDFDETWLWLSYVVWVITAIIGEGVLARFNHELHRQAVALRADGIEVSEELRKEAGRPIGAIAGVTLTLLTILFLYLMVFQPGS